LEKLTGSTHDNITARLFWWEAFGHIDRGLTGLLIGRLDFFNSPAVGRKVESFFWCSLHGGVDMA
jgi:hypothetical protein